MIIVQCKNSYGEIKYVRSTYDIELTDNKLQACKLSGVIELVEKDVEKRLKQLGYSDIKAIKV